MPYNKIHTYPYKWITSWTNPWITLLCLTQDLHERHEIVYSQEIEFQWYSLSLSVALEWFFNQTFLLIDKPLFASLDSHCISLSSILLVLVIGYSLSLFLVLVAPLTFNREFVKEQLLRDWRLHLNLQLFWKDSPCHYNCNCSLSRKERCWEKGIEWLIVSHCFHFTHHPVPVHSHYRTSNPPTSSSKKVSSFFSEEKSTRTDA